MRLEPNDLLSSGNVAKLCIYNNDFVLFSWMVIV